MTTSDNTDDVVQKLKNLRNDSWFGLVSVRPNTEGVLLYERGASRVGGRPAIEIPHDDPYLVDESDIGGSIPPMTFEELCAQYDCITRTVDEFTYVVPVSEY
jgi:hypothetical protein